MLKYTMILLVLVFFVDSKVAPDRFLLPGTTEPILNCGKQLGLKFEDLLDNLEQNAGGLPYKEFDLCCWRSLGMITADNQVNQEVAPKIIALFFPENPEQLEKDCFKSIRDPLNDIWDMSVCIIRIVAQW
ncbi:uncharacterized protein LOC114332632 [Diabrotica virgifera virgifera]|uniref:Uncharacterized protein LOC114332632 n=1 Tax=Diabrotica virgifera virgifera TaxID=50390 RepID=A0A6P7FPW6_DIAVI|nr:uncharacterized protein LOC114332632 [Diabrotica virgifera virgifera]